MYIKTVWIDEGGRRLSATADPYCNLHPDWEVEYLENQWVTGRNGSLLFVTATDDCAGFDDDEWEMWECQVRGVSDLREMLDPAYIYESRPLARFWQNIAEGQSNACAPLVSERTVLVEAVKLIRLIPGGALS